MSGAIAFVVVIVVGLWLCRGLFRSLSPAERAKYQAKWERRIQSGYDRLHGK